MAIQRGVRQPASRDPIQLGPAVAERMALETRPAAQTVRFYVMTHGAERAWEAINRQLAAPAGAVFWIGGAAGVGKTHFLNYVLALENRAGAPNADAGRRLAIGLEVGARIRAGELDRRLLESLAQQLAVDPEAMLWRQMRGAEALNIALHKARRMGVRGVTAVIDFSTSETEPALGHLAHLAEVAGRVRHLNFMVIAAGRGCAPDAALPFDVAPADPAEELFVSIGRARRLAGEAPPPVEAFYDGVDTGGIDPRRIFPFHPSSLSVLRGLAFPPGGIAALAALVRDVLSPGRMALSAAAWRLVLPPDLMNGTAIAERVEGRLGESGCAALRMAYAALDGVTEEDREVAIQAVDALMLQYLAGGPAALSIGELKTRIPALVYGVSGAARSAQALAELMAMLKTRTRGVIAFEAKSARFDPRAAGAPEIARFNAALPLLKKFDSILTPVRESPELRAGLKRLGEAMRSAMEAAHRTGEIVASLARETDARVAREREKTLEDFLALAEAGPSALIEVGADPARRETAIAAVTAYEALAEAAAAVPRMRAMREYLRATGLDAAFDDDPSRDRALVALETECQLLGVAVGPGVVSAAARSMDAIEARFQKFTWTYVQHYRTAHARWQVEMTRLSGVADDARCHLDALRRLNSIAALGAPEGEELAGATAELCKRIVPCDFDGPLAPEITPRCPRCGFVLGTPSPKDALNDLFERIRRALGVKLAALSQSTIARLIRQHDHNRRLEGFLKITQAAQTDALVRVLDDKLARYLAGLLDENMEAADTGEQQTRGVVHGISGARFERNATEVRPSAARERPVKVPPD